MSTVSGKFRGKCSMVCGCTCPCGANLTTSPVSGKFGGTCSITGAGAVWVTSGVGATDSVTGAVAAQEEEECWCHVFGHWRRSWASVTSASARRHTGGVVAINFSSCPPLRKKQRTRHSATLEPKHLPWWRAPFLPA